MSNLKKILLEKVSCKSIWFMRQAGRYLPEFRKIRSKNTNFIELCLNSELSSLITLQPIDRFDLDSAIIFSDILIVPHALGQKVDFIKDYGPELGPFDLEVFLNIKEKDFLKSLSPVYKAIEITRRKLSKEKSLICFIGAPWTLLIYMLDYKKKDVNTILNYPNINTIINKLIKFLTIHIENQINAGADVVQIFDSWAGLLPEKELETFCIKPNLSIIEFCKQKKIPNICFPKGIKKNYEKFNNIVRPDGLSIDYDIEPEWAKAKLLDTVIQGGMNPDLLLKKDDEMYQTAAKYLKVFKRNPYIFNLGHGLLPETDPDKVKKLIKFYRNFNE